MSAPIQSTHGGKREGAGRKRIPAKFRKERINLYLTPSKVRAARKQAKQREKGERSLSRFVDSLLPTPKES